MLDDVDDVDDDDHSLATECGCSWNWRCPGSEREIVTGNGGFAGRSVHRWLKPVTLNFLWQERQQIRILYIYHIISY